MMLKINITSKVFAFAFAAMILVTPLAGIAKQVRPLKANAVTVPTAARIGNVTVGVTTIEELTKMYGEGLPVKGGHPHGGRVWEIKGTRYVIVADGFDYKDGRVIQSFELNSLAQESKDNSDLTLPKARVKASTLLFLGILTPGVSYSETKALIKRRHIKATMSTDEITWREHGHVSVNSQTHYNTWTVHLDFANERLDVISIDCI